MIFILFFLSHICRDFLYIFDFKQVIYFLFLFFHDIICMDASARDGFEEKQHGLSSACRIFSVAFIFWLWYINDINIDTITGVIPMDGHEKTLMQMHRNPKNVRFADVCRVCEHYFGPPRQRGSSHMVFKTPWIGDPRVNIQNDKGIAKVYQVRQILKAIERLNNETITP